MDNSQLFRMKSCGLYIHIPFCRSKCIYCDFFSGGASAADWDLLVDALLNEFGERQHELDGIPDTLYIGGGTPSLIPVDAFRRLIDGIYDKIGGRKQWNEFTIEVNPDDVTEEKCALWLEAGVNRVSMGVQSFVDSELNAIRRRHNADCAEKSLHVLKKHFHNISIDLMFGLPGQTADSWYESVGKAIEINPEHISAYSLMFEDGTPISVMKNLGRLFFPSDDECVEMWKSLSRRLKMSGYSQYEISNYSKPGYESVHNSRYWLGFPYLGIGPSAHSYDGGGVRRANPSDLKGYLRRFSSNNVECSPFYIEETLETEELIEEMLLTRMRMRSGVSLSEFEMRFGIKEKERLLGNAREYIRNDMVAIDNGRLRLTDDGIMIADEIILGLTM